MGRINRQTCGIYELTRENAEHLKKMLNIQPVYSGRGQGMRFEWAYVMTEEGLVRAFPGALLIKKRNGLEVLQIEQTKEEKMHGIKRYRKKPVTIEAIRFTHENAQEIKSWAGEKASYYLNDAAHEVGKAPPVERFYIDTLEGRMEAKPGDYIIKGIAGEFYPCKAEIFEATYEKEE